MSDSIVGALEGDADPPATQARILGMLLIRVLQRLSFSALLVVGVVFFVALAMNLAQRGGIRALPEATPAAAKATLHIFQDLSAGRVDATQELRRALPKSLGLLFVSLSLGAILGLMLGGLAALRRNSRISAWIITSSILGISTPSYVAAMFLIWTVVWIYQRTGVRILPVFGFGWDLRLVMPMIVLATRPMANMTRLSYTALMDVFEADYVRTARSKGLYPRVVFLRHVLRNAGVPILTTASVALRFSLSMLPIVEYIFTWPGIGLALIDAGRGGDFPRLVVMILPLVLLFALVTILLDLLYPLIDPRLLDAKGAD
jgi:peptide/nickel transport system permease protein